MEKESWKRNLMCGQTEVEMGLLVLKHTDTELEFGFLPLLKGNVSYTHTHTHTHY